MLEIHLYGILRELVKDSKASEDTILSYDYLEGERFSELLNRLKLDAERIGDCFINGILASPDVVLKDGDRIGLFPYNMVLIDGGIHLKYHPNKR